MDEFLKRAMRDRSWKIPQLAEACDVNPGLAARWTSGNPRYRVTPGPASCAKIAQALNVDVDYVLELAGHRKPQTAKAEVSPVQAELDARLARLAARLPKYPRAFWHPLIDAWERMADAGDAFDWQAASAAVDQASQPPVSASGLPRVSAATRVQRRGSRGSDGSLAKSSRPRISLPPLLVPIFAPSY